VRGKIITVTGPIEPAQMGLTLPHEHILVDFAGAEVTGRHRYRVDDVVETMLPYLEAIKAQGVRTLVECTPMYLARDVEVFRDLSRRTGLRILTNTGQYKEPFLPAATFTIDAEALAEQWVAEAEGGIDGTDARPGFIKTAVNPEPLAPVQRKVIRAAAMASRATGLAIATHTGRAAQAMEVLDIVEGEGVAPDRWIFVHAQNETDTDRLLAVARRGAWIELDGLGETTVERHLEPLLALLDAGFESKVLLSHDAGWYRVGEEPGGKKKPFTFLLDRFVPILRARGASDATIRRVTAINPAEAFTVR
jgi:predicted metal-dependent phosphotriesterase family hydrolase